MTHLLDHVTTHLSPLTSPPPTSHLSSQPQCVTNVPCDSSIRPGLCVTSRENRRHVATVRPWPDLVYPLCSLGKSIRNHPYTHYVERSGVPRDGDLDSYLVGLARFI